MYDDLKAFLRELFNMCLYANYTSVENAGSFALEEYGDTLYVLFEKSNGAEDWENNLDFGAVLHSDSGAEVLAAYSNMEKNWFCHGGFLRVWKSILPYLEGYLLDLRYRHIICVGYSHGAAIALLCHEYIWYNRKDLIRGLEGYGFGCPRVIYGHAPREKERWNSFFVVRNLDDIVTHLPPAILGYRHVGKMINVGKWGKYSRIDAHKSENYLRELELGK
jgi:hypothetical protein